MSIRYDDNIKASAVRLVREHRDDYDSKWAALKAISGRSGMSAAALRKRVRQAEVDAGNSALINDRHITSTAGSNGGRDRVRRLPG